LAYQYLDQIPQMENEKPYFYNYNLGNKPDDLGSLQKPWVGDEM